jgi:hypothetical protein
MSHMSFSTPAPIVVAGDPKNAAKVRDTANTRNSVAAPPTIVKTRAMGKETLYMIVRPQTSEAAEANKAPTPRPAA